MSIVRDDCDERQTRVDQMIDEFRRAQSRRLAKAPALKCEDPAGAPKLNAQAAVAVAIATPSSH